MIKLNKKQLIELFKSGNFTIVYWDNYCPTVYKGKWNINNEFDRDEYETMNESEIDFDFVCTNGYLPTIVSLLTEALSGKTDSI